MSKKCPYCGSHNTRICVENYVGRTIVNSGRLALAIGAGLLGEVIHPVAGHRAAEKMWEKTDPGKMNSYYCNYCKRDFSA